MSPRTGTLLRSLIPLAVLAVAAVVVAPFLVASHAFYPIGYMSPGALAPMALLVAGWSAPVLGVIGAGRLLVWGLRRHGRLTTLPPIAPLALLVAALVTATEFTEVFGNSFVGSGFRGLIDAMDSAIDLAVLLYAAVGILLALHWYLLRWRGEELRPDVPGPVAEAVAEPVPAKSAPADPVDRLPDRARSIALRVRDKAAWLLERDRLLPTGSSDLQTTRVVLDRHLPATVDAYLRVPGDGADLPVTPDGRTGTQLVEEQLGMLEGALDDVMRRVVDLHARLLVENGDVLQQELGSPRA